MIRFKQKEGKIMNTTKFEIIKNNIEISHKNRVNVKEGCSLEQDNQDPKIIKSFVNKDDALLELQNYTTEITELSGAFTYYNVTEYYVEENVYDEDNEWLSGGDVWGFSKIQIEVNEKSSYETVGVQDNLIDVKGKLHELDEGFLSLR